MADFKQDKLELEQDLVRLAVEYLTLTKAQLDPYTSKKSIVQEEPLGASMYTPSHIQFAKYGRGKGKRPPFQEVFDWVKRKNIQFTGLTQKGTASAIVASIGKNGTIGYTPNAPDAMEEALLVNYNEYIRKTNDELVVYFTRATKKIYEEIPVQEKLTI